MGKKAVDDAASLPLRRRCQHFRRNRVEGGGQLAAGGRAVDHGLQRRQFRRIDAEALERREFRPERRARGKPIFHHPGDDGDRRGVVGG